jgi:hypothetical protein
MVSSSSLCEPKNSEMEKSVQRLFVRSHFIMLLLLILIAVAHYSRSNSIHSGKPLQKKGMVTSARNDNSELVVDGSPTRILHLIMTD